MAVVVKYREVTSDKIVEGRGETEDEAIDALFAQYIEPLVASGKSIYANWEHVGTETENPLVAQDTTVKKSRMPVIIGVAAAALIAGFLFFRKR